MGGGGEGPLKSMKGQTPPDHGVFRKIEIVIQGDESPLAGINVHYADDYQQNEHRKENLEPFH
jgi:hypothetical protein